MTSGYPPLPEPFAEALGEAAQTAAMAYRLVMTISDAVRRATQKRLTGTEEELGEDAKKMAPGCRPTSCEATSATTSWPC
ncbi:hypothetical protein OG373_02670 [Streptomyces avidinii]|uniref:hypothetical protein n=1 Tax=Streptomyces avidinii TaxID=1895 RepID=UPI0038693514|nr:hypothetical protein OG373_02670 [Streptomyces avidinii]